MLLPAPTPPGTRYSLSVSESVCRSGRAVCSAESDPPAMMDRVPSAARLVPPETGLSTKWMSLRLRVTSSFATEWAYEAGMVEQRRRVAFGGRSVLH